MCMTLCSLVPLKISYLIYYPSCKNDVENTMSALVCRNCLPRTVISEEGNLQRSAI